MNKEQSWSEKNAKHEYMHRNKTRGWLIFLIIAISILVFGGGIEWIFEWLYSLSN